jgi:hypothetical protein
VAINVLALSLPERRSLFATLLPSICELRARSGRPHWPLVDEAHQALPTIEWELERRLPDDLPGTILVKVDPASLSPEVLKRLDVILIFGTSSSKMLASFAAKLNMPVPTDIPTLAYDEILFWSPKSGQSPRAVNRDIPRQLHHQHTGKYALGDVGERRSFYFRGPDNAFSLRARNLAEFLRISDRVDEDMELSFARHGLFCLV